MMMIRLHRWKWRIMVLIVSFFSFPRTILIGPISEFLWQTLSWPTVRHVQSLLLLCSRAQERLRPWCMRVCASWGCGQLSSYHLWFLLLIQYMILCPLYASTPATINLCLPWSRLITDWPVRGTLTGQKIFGIKTTSFQFRLLQIHWEQPICWGQMWRLRFIAPMTDT
jgi:hypothetical protein